MQGFFFIFQQISTDNWVIDELKRDQNQLIVIVTYHSEPEIGNFLG